MIRSLYKKLIICSLACSVVTFSSCEMLEMLGGGSSNTPTVSDGTESSTDAETESTSAGSPEETAETTAEPTDEAGGNPEDGVSIAVYEITVSENTYIYENHEISYDELIEIFDTLNENDVVTLFDDNASLDAYSKLTSALEERSIAYIDDNPDASGGEETEE